MTAFTIEFKDPRDVRKVEADYWLLDESTEWFDFYVMRPDIADEDLIVLTVRSSDVRTITRHETLTPA